MDDPSVARALSKSASGLGFAITRQTVELSGLCPRCRSAAAT
jgi:Fur family zinc uptake transcriptional regulator